jgi:predicted dehydrogenase
MQAGKDVYIEKPCSHNVSEGRKLVEIANQTKRIIQHGTQGRSSSSVIAAVQFMKEGGIGKVHTAKGLCYKWRPSIGVEPDSQPNKGVDYNLWLGPAAVRPFNRNRYHYNWHYHWDYGNGDLGNQGVHQMDVARWGLGKDVHPTKINAAGGRYGYKDQGETPNTLICTYDYGDSQLVFEVRGLPTNEEQGVKVGNIWYGADGFLAIETYGKWTAYKGQAGKAFMTSEQYMKENKTPPGGDHFQNFIDAVRSRKVEDQRASIKEGHMSSSLCHLGNIAYRVGRTVVFDPETETFGDDAAANKYLSREYRAPFTMPTQA